MHFVCTRERIPLAEIEGEEREREKDRADARSERSRVHSRVVVIFWSRSFIRVTSQIFLPREVVATGWRIARAVLLSPARVRARGESINKTRVTSPSDARNS